MKVIRFLWEFCHLLSGARIIKVKDWTRWGEMTVPMHELFRRVRISGVAVHEDNQVVPAREFLEDSWGAFRAGVFFVAVGQVQISYGVSAIYLSCSSKKNRRCCWPRGKVICCCCLFFEASLCRARRASTGCTCPRGNETPVKSMAANTLTWKRETMVESKERSVMNNNSRILW